MIKDQLRNVQQIQASRFASLQSGVIDLPSLVGDSDYGGYSIAVQDQLTSVQQVPAFDGAFFAILDKGSVVTWGFFRR